MEGGRPWQKQYSEILCMQPPYRQVISIPVPAEGEGSIRKWTTSALSAQGPFPSAHAHRQHLQGRQWPGSSDRQEVTLYLHIGLLAPLYQLVEGWGTQVVVHMGRVEPL